MGKYDFLSNEFVETVDPVEWEREIETNRLNAFREKTIQDFWMKSGDMPKHITFLNEGKQFLFHIVTDAAKRPHNFICKPSGYACEFCGTGHKAVRRVVYAVIDWFYFNQQGEQVDRPSVKLFMRGKTDYQSFEQRRKNPKQGDGTLLGQKWEVTRNGNVYDLLSAGPTEVDWDETTPYKKKDGTVIDLPVIRRYDWPEYPINETSIFSEKDKRDELPEMDWSNPKLVDMWITAYFLNTPESEYLQFAGVSKKQPAKKSVEPRKESHKQVSVDDDDDIPF